MARARHPKKEIEAAIQHAEANGWRVTVGGSHAWGKLYWLTIAQHGSESRKPPKAKLIWSE
jgi:hypothetical protein